MLTYQLSKTPCLADDLRMGKVEALTCHVYRYLKPLTRYGTWMIKNEFAAEDLAAASLEKLWHQRRHMDTDRTIHTYLRKTMYGLCCAWLHEQLILRGFIQPRPGWEPRFVKPKQYTNTQKAAGRQLAVATNTHVQTTEPGAPPQGGLPPAGGQEETSASGTKEPTHPHP